MDIPIKARQFEFQGVSGSQLFGMVVGTAVGWLVIAGTHDRPGWVTSEWPSPRIPFATHGVIWSHLLAALPIAWWLVTRLVRASQGVLDTPARRQVVTLIGLSGAALLAGITISSEDALPGWSPERTFLENNTLRTVWSVAWQVCTSLIIQMMVPQQSAPPQDLAASPQTSLFSLPGLGLLLLLGSGAWIVPQIYINDLISRQTQLAVQHLREDQLRLAWDYVQNLVDLGSTSPIGDASPSAVQASLESSLGQLINEVRTPFPTDANDELVMSRARVFQHLALWDDAITLLEPVASRQPQASLQLAKLFEEQGELEKSIESCENAWKLLGEQVEPNALRTRAELLVKWAHNLRRVGRASEAEQLLLDTRAKWPTDNGLIEYELGYHYKEAGFHQQSRVHFELAAQMDDQYEARVANEIEAIDMEMSYCMPATPNVR